MSVLQMMTSELRGMQTELSRMKENWGWFLTGGIIVAFCGATALFYAAFTTITSVLFLGWLLLIGGAVNIAHAFFTGSWGSFFLEFLSGILSCLAGLLMMSSPAITAVTLTIMLAPLFMVGGLFRAVGSAVTRYPHWGWVCFSGVITFLAGLMIWNQLPGSAFWVIGALVGVELLCRGFAMIAFATSLRAMPAVPELKRAA